MVEFNSGLGADSIRKNLKPSNIISDIKLTLSSAKNKVCVVVEGESDQKLFRPLLSKNSDIRLVGGWIWVNNIVDHYWKLKNKRVIGIRDKDYSSKPINEQCFFCDYCCAEMMIISIDNCFDKLCRNYYKGKMKSADLRIYCLERLEKLSQIRMLTYIEKWNISFRNFKPSKHYQDSIDNMNKAIIADLNRINTNNQIDAIKEEMFEKIHKCSTLQEYLSITNGHDFLDLFCKVAIGKHGRHDKNKKDIENFMLKIFGENEFMSTDLYKDLLDYQKKNNITIV